eukprot:4632452-Heterocapsa_arctica.AAC.1
MIRHVHFGERQLQQQRAQDVQVLSVSGNITLEDPAKLIISGKLTISLLFGLCACVAVAVLPDFAHAVKGDSR